VNSRFCRLKKKLGVKFCLYNFRHSFATRLLESGVDALTVATLLGHTDVSMLGKVYQHLAHNPGHLLSQVRTTVG
jgi:integrase